MISYEVSIGIIILTVVISSGELNLTGSGNLATPVVMGIDSCNY